ncbi:MAG: MazG-like family protein [Inconstantimicrobium porci]|uniref:MazG-like family protein n=1 Tax=Inconstantimicrobium porci TaxID=2652291 RepID=A0A7X2MZ16_9CLOT|nr:MazG-like family protein [Inconstantimicrobium porci]MDD6771329.1 MazG-like family protein [Inconstantimicrobium porci]MDY5912665.1 MazG-like family protein [Inconstantimicrobium porci]MSR91658.1 MazG-like family protein [Inconstantimicrobium porci]
MNRDDFNIMGNIKSIEQLKAQLLCIIGEFFRLLTKGSNVAKDAILNCISNAIIVLYVLGDKLGYSAVEIDEDMKKKLKIGVIEDDTVEREGKSLSKLYSHLKTRE